MKQPSIIAHTLSNCSSVFDDEQQKPNILGLEQVPEAEESCPSSCVTEVTQSSSKSEARLSIDWIEENKSPVKPAAAVCIANINCERNGQYESSVNSNNNNFSI